MYPRVQNPSLPVSPAYVYTDDYFNRPQTRTFLQDLQPNLYMYGVSNDPISSNIGISYPLQNAANVLTQVYNDQTRQTYPVYTSVDPQMLIPNVPQQFVQNPTRTNWSQEYSNVVYPPGTIRYEDIQDPRFMSYGDESRAYSNMDLNQVEYDYQDVDAYRIPNFIQRSKVDFMEYRNGDQVMPYYERTAGLDDVRANVEADFTDSSIHHRADFAAVAMNKMNSIMAQRRQAPLRRTANSMHSTYGPS